MQSKTSLQAVYSRLGDFISASSVCTSVHCVLLKASLDPVL